MEPEAMMILDQKLYRVNYRVNDTPQPSVLIHAGSDSAADRELLERVREQHGADAVLTITSLEELPVAE
jgi:hypothetical protein